MKQIQTSRTALAAGLVLLMVLLLGLVGDGAAEQPADYAEALASVAELDQPLVLDFYTDW